MAGIDLVMAALGTSHWVFVCATVILFGWAAFMTGQALAQTWRPLWHLVPYSLMLAAGNSPSIMRQKLKAYIVLPPHRQAVLQMAITSATQTGPAVR